MKSKEPEVLRRGKAFHKRVQEGWKKSESGRTYVECTIELKIKSRKTGKTKKGRMDLFVNELGDFVSVVEIKSTDWDKVKAKNRKKLLGSHRRQIWRYIDKYVDDEQVDVCPGIIYPAAPSTPGLKSMIENYLNEYGLQVVWYDD